MDTHCLCNSVHHMGRVKEFFIQFLFSFHVVCFNKILAIQHCCYFHILCRASFIWPNLGLFNLPNGYFYDKICFFI